MSRVNGKIFWILIQIDCNLDFDPNQIILALCKQGITDRSTSSFISCRCELVSDSVWCSSDTDLVSSSFSSSVSRPWSVVSTVMRNNKPDNQLTQENCLSLRTYSNVKIGMIPQKHHVYFITIMRIILDTS